MPWIPSGQEVLECSGCRNAVCERSAHVMNSDSAVQVISSDLSLQTGKSLSGVAGSRPCMPQGRFLTVCFVPHGMKCPFRTFTSWNPSLAQRRGSAVPGSVHGVWGTQEKQQLPFFVARICTVETEHLDCWGEWLGGVLDGTQGSADGSVTPSLPWTMLPFTRATE